MSNYYSEAITMPTPVLLATTTLTTLVVTVFVSFIKMSTMPNSEWELLFPPAFFAVCWLVMLFMFRFTTTVKVSIENTLLFSGKRGPSLIVRGSKRGEKSYVPLHIIEEIVEVTFEGPWWRPKVTGGLQQQDMSWTGEQKAWWRTFLHMRDEHDPISVSTNELFGYQGTGLQVTYRGHALTSGGNKLVWKHQFSTQDPVLLKSVLESLPPEMSE